MSRTTRRQRLMPSLAELAREVEDLKVKVAAQPAQGKVKAAFDYSGNFGTVGSLITANINLPDATFSLGITSTHENVGHVVNLTPRERVGAMSNPVGSDSSPGTSLNLAPGVWLIDMYGGGQFRWEADSDPFAGWTGSPWGWPPWVGTWIALGRGSSSAAFGYRGYEDIRFLTYRQFAASPLHRYTATGRPSYRLMHTVAEGDPAYKIVAGGRFTSSAAPHTPTIKRAGASRVTLLYLGPA